MTAPYDFSAAVNETLRLYGIAYSEGLAIRDGTVISYTGGAQARDRAGNVGGEEGHRRRRQSLFEKPHPADRLSAGRNPEHRRFGIRRLYKARKGQSDRSVRNGRSVCLQRMRTPGGCRKHRIADRNRGGNLPRLCRSDGGQSAGGGDFHRRLCVLRLPVPDDRSTR